MRMLCLCILFLLPVCAFAQDAGDNIDSSLSSAPRMVKHLHQHGVNILKEGNLQIRLYKKGMVTFLDDTITYDQLKTYDSWDWNYTLNPMESATDLGSEMAGIGNSYKQYSRRPIQDLGTFLHDLHMAVAQ